MCCNKRQCTEKNVLFSYIMLLIKSFRIGPVTGPRLIVLDRGRMPRSNTADRGPVTGPIRNNLIHEIFSIISINCQKPITVGRSISSASTSSTPSTFLAPMSDILSKDADVIFVYSLFYSIG